MGGIEKCKGGNKERGIYFKQLFEDRAEIIYCDNQEYEMNGAIMKFSPPFPHGPEGIRLGYVVMVSLEAGKKILFASDVQGPVYEGARDYIIEETPDLLIMDGPPSYFLGWRFSQENLRRAEENLMKIMENVDCQLILDHHLLRDIKYRERMKNLYEIYGERIKTFAEWNGMENNLLEARRKELWEKY